MNNRIFVITALLLLSGCPLPRAGSSVTTSPIQVAATFETIAITAPFSGGGSSLAAKIEFRTPAGSGAWHNAYTPIIDKRSTVHVNTGDQSNSANQNQARGSIVGLQQDTEYEVRVTWANGTDGISGTNPLTATLKTVSRIPPSGGKTVYVDFDVSSEGSGTSSSPYKTITNAVNLTAAGDTILVRDSSQPYSALSLLASGTATAYRFLKADAGAHPVLAGGGGVTLTVGGNYWYVSGFTIQPSQGTGNSAHNVMINANVHHVYIDSNTLPDIAPKAAAGTAYPSGIDMEGGNNNIFITNNVIKCVTVMGNFSAGPSVDGIFVARANTIVIDNNTIESVEGGAGVNDGIGNANSDISNWTNVAITRNKILFYHDDCAELDGGGINVVFLMNTCTTRGLPNTSGYGGTALSGETIAVGPCYVARNIFTVSASQSYGFKWASTGPCFVFHNTMDTWYSTSGGARTAIASGDGTLFFNNIYRSAGNAYENGNGGGVNVVLHDWDYNLSYIPNGADYAYSWNGTNYSTLGAFSSATGYEKHGKSGDPKFADSNYNLSSSSPAIDAGVVIDNFNSVDSAWPYTGAAPDMGALESGGSPPVNNPIPVLASMSPSSATAGANAFTLTAAGSNFISSSQVQWNGSARSTTFVNAGQVTASIPAGDVSSAGSATVAVFNPSPGGGTSQSLGFTINSPAGNPVPALASISPTSTTAGAPSFTLTVNGSSFVSASQVKWNGIAKSTSFSSASLLTATISAGDVATAGSASVTVFNPSPGGGTSPAVVFTITANQPVPLTLGTVIGLGATGNLSCSNSGTETFVGLGNQNRTETSVVRFVAPANMTLSGLTARLGGIVPILNGIVVTVRPSVNRIDSAALACTMRGGDASCQDTADTHPVTAGDLISISITCSGVSSSLPGPVTFSLIGK